MRATPPASLGLFVGRQRELGRLGGLAGERLATVRGTAGIGKTRLVVEHLRTTQVPHVFVDLTEATTPDALESAVLRALGAAPGGSSDDSLEALIAAAGDRLLVLDNFEQLLPAGALRIARWLAAGDQLRLLVTSRAELGVPGELVIELGPLAMSTAGHDPLESEAGRLLLDRAARTRADYRVEGAELARVAAVLQALEGIPLAIEIVAPRLARFGGEAVEARLSERLGWSGSTRGTLGDAIATSWQLLDDDERDAIARCSVFRGGFDLEAAEALVSKRGAGASALELLHALTSKSLLRVGDLADARPGRRFDLFLSVREWVTDQLEPDVARGLGADHAAHYAERARRAVRDTVGPDAAEARRWLSRERENLHAASRSEHAAPDHAAHCLIALQIVATTEGPLAPYADDVRALSRHQGLSPEVALELRIANVQVLQKLGRLTDASTEASRAIDEARAHPRLEPAALYARGCVELAEGALVRASETFEQGIASAVRADDRAVEASCSASLGAALAGLGALGRAREAVERARVLHVEVGNLREEGMASAFLGNLCIDEGLLAEGELHFAQAMAIVGELGDRFGEAFIVANLAMLHHRSDSLGAAIEEYGAALDGFARVGARRYLGAFEGYRALAEHGRGDGAAAMAGLGRAIAHLRAARDARFEAFFEAMQAAIELERGAIGSATSHLDAASARLRPTDDPMLATAIALPRALLARHRAQEAATRGEIEEAAACRREAEEILATASRRAPGGRTPEESSFEVFLALRLCGVAPTVSRTPEARATVLSMAADGSWLQAPRAARVDLEHRPSLKRLLATLIEARSERPGRPISRDALQAAGWPGERMRASAAANRVRVGIATLRRLGLRDVLRTETAGWVLDPAAELQLVGDVVRAPADIRAIPLPVRS